MSLVRGRYCQEMLLQSTKLNINKDDLGRISSGFMMFGGEKLEWEEEKYLQGAKNL